jgi:hypothetical protein
VRARQTIPVWLQVAFSDWITGRIDLDEGGNYRSRLPRRPVVPYNRLLKRLYPNNQDFQRAADLWLSLWEAVPTARLKQGDRISRAASGRRS